MPADPPRVPPRVPDGVRGLLDEYAKAVVRSSTTRHAKAYAAEDALRDAMEGTR